MIYTNKNITLRELAVIEKISFWTNHVCQKNKLVDLNSIIHYYIQNGSFKDLKSSNLRSVKELLSICNKYYQQETKPENIAKVKEHTINKINKSIKILGDTSSISLRVLAKHENLSARAKNLCENADLFYLSDILNFHKENGNFNKLRNCGTNSNRELLNICYKYENAILKPTDNMFWHMAKLNASILDEVKQLSNRTRNALLKYFKNKVTVEKLDKSRMLESGFNFHSIQNIGKKSVIELEKFCENIKWEIDEIEKETDLKIIGSNNKARISNIIDDLSIKQKVVLNNILTAKLSSLSHRSRDALKSYLDQIITIKSLIERIFSNINFKLGNLKNIGNKTSEELYLFLKEIEELIIKIASFENEADLTRELLNAIMIKRFLIDQKTILKISENYDFSDGIPLFKMINILIENDYIFKENEKNIFKQTLGFFENKDSSTLDKIADIVDLTREKTVRLRNSLLSNFNQYFSFVSLFEKDNLNIYNLDATVLILNIDQIFIDELLKNEIVNFNKFFINRIFAIVLKDKYYLIGNEKKGILGYTSRKHHNWISTYLISKQFQSIFDFEELINDVAVRLSDKIDIDYKLHFQSYLLDFKKSDCFIYLDEISQIAEHVLFNEFELILDIEDNIVFKRNTNPLIIEYVHEILRGVNKPLKIDEILDALNQQYPEITSSKTSLQIRCQRDSHIVYFGNTTYGLKIWEKEHKNRKGGNMRDITEEFLMQFDEPKHLDEIVLFVSKYRENVKPRNLFTNLKIAEHKRFVFFKNKYIGLVTKLYDKSIYKAPPEKNINKRTWEENYKALETFFHENKRLPYSTGNDIEMKLYRFFYFQVKKLSELNDTKKEQLESFMLKANYKKGARRTKSKSIQKPTKHTELNRTSHNVTSIKDIYIIDYSEKSIAIYGNTKPIKDILSTLGCRYNRYLTINELVTPGWIASIKLKKEISEFLFNLKQ